MRCDEPHKHETEDWCCYEPAENSKHHAESFQSTTSDN
jgi:hypothetical protein